MIKINNHITVMRGRYIMIKYDKRHNRRMYFVGLLLLIYILLYDKNKQPLCCEEMVL